MESCSESVKEGGLFANCLTLRLHAGAQDGVDVGLAAALLAEPAGQVGVEAHGHDARSPRRRAPLLAKEARNGAPQS